MFARLLFELPRACPGKGGKLAVDDTDARKPGPQCVDVGAVTSGRCPIDDATAAADRELAWLPPPPPPSTTSAAAASAGVGAESHIGGSTCCTWVTSSGARLASAGSRNSISPLRLPAPRCCCECEAAAEDEAPFASPPVESPRIVKLTGTLLASRSCARDKFPLCSFAICLFNSASDWNTTNLRSSHSGCGHGKCSARKCSASSA